MNQAWTRYLPRAMARRLEGRPELQQAISNTGWLFGERILRLALGLALNVWVTRYLGPERFGLLSYATTFVLLFGSVAQLGLDGIVVRNLVRDPAQRDQILGSAFLLKLGGGVLSLALIVLSIGLVRPADPVSRLLVGIIALGTLFQAFGVIDCWFQSQVRAKYSAYTRSAVYLAICVAKLVLLLTRAPLVAFAWLGLAEIALGSLAFLAAFRISGLRISHWRACGSMARELIRDSWPLMLSDIVMQCYLRVDKILVGEIAGNSELGIYSVAALLAELLYFIPAAVYPSVFPSIVAARETDEELFYRRLQRFYNLMAFLAYAVALPVTLLSGWLIPLLFGAAYARAALMLIGLVWAGIFINFMIARSQFLTVMNWTRLHFITDLLGCAVNVGLNLVLIPRYGAMGAVFASIVSYWFLAHGTCFLFRPLFRTGWMLTRAMFYPKIW
jgi:O-antigen/teichoic acid export membrane protein